MLIIKKLEKSSDHVFISILFTRTMNRASHIALGTAQFGLNYGVANKSGIVHLEEVRKILNFSWKAGVRNLDTAINYGKSEDVLGSIGISGWQVTSKLPAAPTDCGDIRLWVITQMEGSLRRLKLPKLHALLLHKPQQLFDPIIGSKLLNALRDLKELGLVDKIGISIYDPAELSCLTKLTFFDLVQAPLNILDQGLVQSGWAKKLKFEGVELHIRSVFLQGLLLMSENTRPSKFDQFQSIWSEWSEWLLASKLSPLQACLAYVLSIKEIDKLIVGVESEQQLMEIVDATNVKLKDSPEWSCIIPPSLIYPSNWDQL